MIDCKIITDEIDIGLLIGAASDGDCGAVAVFAGTVRRSSAASDLEVVRLEYQAYGPMAEREMLRIAGEAAEQFQVRNIIVHHRVGTLALRDMAVAVIVASPHRVAAFDACRYVIEELKRRVPIWKKEIFTDGDGWVNARP